MPGFYYAHVPSLGLRTHGSGVDGAHAAARDLIHLWVGKSSRRRNAILKQVHLSEDEFRAFPPYKHRF